MSGHQSDKDNFGEPNNNVADYFMEIGLPESFTESEETESSRQIPVKYPIIAIACTVLTKCTWLCLSSPDLL